MSYYTERHGLRAPVEKTDIITYEMYALIFDCCESYFDNIAWKYPEECPDGNGCCGIDIYKLSNTLKFEIPQLFQSENGVIVKPQKGTYYGEDDNYDQYALLDFIEFMFFTVRDISSRCWHSYYRHDDISFRTTNEVAYDFRNDINNIFDKTGLLYTLSETGMVERIDKTGIVSTEIENEISQVSEKGLKELLQDAILLYKTPSPQARQDSVEKIWDALERLKTYYTDMDKKTSANKIVNDMANDRAEFVTIFNAEFKELTDIGNNFRIRHHETNKIDITDLRHYDYFFNRCLSLIALAIQYLK